MDWPTVHHYAEEVELWTSLAINSWVIVGAISFLVLRVYRAAMPFADRLSRAVAWGAAIVGTAFFVVSAYYSIQGWGGDRAVALLHLAAMAVTLSIAYLGLDNFRDRR